MKKNELSNGMIVEFRDGRRALVLHQTFMYIDKYSSSTFDVVSDDLISSGSNSEYDIMKVFRVKKYSSFEVLFQDFNLDLIWKRRPAKEMTLEEIEKALGYSIKIVYK